MLSKYENLAIDKANTMKSRFDYSLINKFIKS